jgi:thiol-disulfide isomerase/thioredoxin
MNLKSLWKPIVLVLVIGIMAADLILDAQADRQTKQISETNITRGLQVGTAVGDLAPDFEGRTLDGETFRLSDLRGKTVLVNVFASWCGPCRLEMPHIVEASNQLSEDEVAFVGINLQEDPEAVARFKEEFGIDFPLLLNENGDLTNDLFTPIGLPTSWFIDSQGVVRYVFAGAMTQDFLLDILDDIQAGREPDPFG